MIPNRANAYETRRHRRKALCLIIEQLESIMNAEAAYLNNIPENLQGSETYESAENAVSVLEEALDILDGAYL